MPYLSRFQTDLFISYGHLDNDPSGEDERRWISRFHADLQRRVSQYLGSEIQVWRDNFLQGNQDFSEEITRNLADTAAWIPILSPRFLSSDWCRRELHIFSDRLQRAGDEGETQSCIFKVVKTLINLQQQPEILQRTLGYEFYYLNEEGRPRELPDWDPAPDAQKKYLAKLDDLAYDLHLLLKKMKELEQQKRPVSPAGSIYLAETTRELSDSRDRIRRELLAQGYQVLPDRPLPFEVSDLTQLAVSQLEACRLSLHLIGGRFGVVPDGVDEKRSVVWIQQELAAQRQAKGNFHCLIWVPPGTEVTDNRQQQYLDYLEEQLRVQSGFELLRISPEALKSYIFDKLAERPPRTVVPPEKRLRIYLICEPQDCDAIRPIQECLMDHQVGVDLPLWEGDPAEKREDHEATLQDCDGVLIYHGAGSEAWLRQKIRELRRAPGLGRKRPFIPQGIYIGPEPTAAKQTYTNDEFVLVRNFGQLTRDLMDPFLAGKDPAIGVSA